LTHAAELQQIKNLISLAGLSDTGRQPVEILEPRAMMDLRMFFIFIQELRCRMTDQSGSPLWQRPSTRPGWWAVGLAAASIVLNLAWSILPGGAVLGFICGFVGGVLALIALIRRQEHSWLVFLSILPMLSVLFFILGEILIPH
jgi:hypothetical protein